MILGHVTKSLDTSALDWKRFETEAFTFQQDDDSEHATRATT